MAQAIVFILGFLLRYGRWLFRAGMVIWFSYQAYKMTQGENALVDWLVHGLGWSLDWAEMPEIPAEWGTLICAVNGWFPVAEAWIVFKLWLTLQITIIPLKWGLRIFGTMGADGVA